MHNFSYNFQINYIKIYLQTLFTTGGINRIHHDNGAPINILEITICISLYILGIKIKVDISVEKCPPKWKETNQ